MPMNRKKEKANNLRGLERASLPSETQDLAAKSKANESSSHDCAIQISFRCLSSCNVCKEPPKE